MTSLRDTRASSEVHELTSTTTTPSRVVVAAAGDDPSDDDDLAVYGPGAARSTNDYGDANEEVEEQVGLLDKAVHTTRPGHRVNRAGSFGSLSFNYTVLPLALSLEVGSDRSQRGGSERVPSEARLTLSNGIGLVVGMQIGSGIFSSPGAIVDDTGSVGAALLVWLASGILAWTGASSFAELGTAVPVNGGSQAYLRYALGPCAGYLFTWTAIMALKSSACAIIAIVTGEYLCRIVYHTAFSAAPSESANNIPVVAIKSVASVVLAFVTILNAFSARAGTQALTILTALKMIALLAVSVMGFVQLGLGKRSEALKGNIFEGTSFSFGDYALAMYSGLWAYDGWDSSNYVAGELKNVKRDLPRVIHGSMLLVVILYLMANISYFLVLPKSQVAHSNTIALDFGRELFGPVGGLIFTLIVAISCIGALNSSIFSTSRLVAVAGNEGYIPKVFAKFSSRGTPQNALILQFVLTVIMIFLGNFKSLISFSGVCAWFWYLGTVVSLLILRIREPELDRTYRVWLVTPIVFSCVATFLLLMPIFAAPLQALAAFGFIALGLPLYFMTQYRADEETRFATFKTLVVNLFSRNTNGKHSRLDTEDMATTVESEEADQESTSRKRQSNGRLALSVPTLPRVSEATSEDERLSPSRLSS